MVWRVPLVLSAFPPSDYSLMKAISIKAPHGWNICLGRKTAEIRSWKTSHRGPLLVCLAAEPDWRAISPQDPELARMPLGHAICVVQQTDCRPFIQDDESAALIFYKKDHYAHIYEDVRPVVPFPVRGQLGLFEVEVPGEALTMAGRPI